MSKVILAYKNFAANRNISHIGLGVSALNNAKVLRRHGVPTEVWPVVSPADLSARLAQSGATHVVISAPWIPTCELQRLSNLYPDIQFAMNCHSNVGFLQADANGVKLLREAMELETGSLNFHVSGNSGKFCRWVTASYGVPCAYLPNLYYLTSATAPQRPLWRAGVLRIGAFGATRPLKNFISAAGAALEISRDLKADLGGEMRRIAGFLGIGISEALWPQLIEAASFEAMQAQGDLLMPIAREVWDNGAKRFFNQGTNGQWRTVCSPDDLARYDELVSTRFTPDLAHWLEHGRLRP